MQNATVLVTLHVIFIIGSVPRACGHKRVTGRCIRKPVPFIFAGFPADNIGNFSFSPPCSERFWGLRVIFTGYLARFYRG